MLVDALPVDQLLRGNVADSEEDGRGDGLREEGPRREAGLVPRGLSVIFDSQIFMTGFGGCVFHSPSKHDGRCCICCE
jgi:hypothetical protein